jgi:hypothetical protein
MLRYMSGGVCAIYSALSASLSLSLLVSHSLVLSIRKFFAERIILFMCGNVENVLIENYFL